MNWTSWSDRKIIGALVLLQCVVCLPFINSFPVALDEPFSIYWAQQDTGDMLELFKGENNPPLHFLLLHVWIKLFGIGPVAVRSLSLLFSLLTIPVIYHLSKRLMNKPFAVFVALVFISSYFNHYHALEARGYSLFVLLSTLSFLELYKFIFEEKKNFLLFALWNVLLLYTHYLAGFIITCEYLIFLVFNFRRTGEMLKILIGSSVVSLALYSPGLYWFMQRLGDFSEKGTWVPEAQFTELYGNIVRFYNNYVSFLLYVLAILLIIVISRKELVWKLKDHLIKQKVRFVAALFCVPYLGMFVFSKLVQPVFLDRYLLFTSIPLYILSAILIFSVLPERRSNWVFLAIIALSINTHWIPQNNREPNMMVKHIIEKRKPADPIVICPPYYDLTFLYHFDRGIFSDYKSKNQALTKNYIYPIYSFFDFKQTEEFENIFLVDANYDFAIPGNTVKADFASHYQLIDSIVFKGEEAVYQYRNK